ncbi:hypothetical protein JVU11DRAFT_12616 [Chiua virens]|nr:hypothetical protein JVU11DRAFT_12616 [Chiua virens]
MSVGVINLRVDEKLPSCLPPSGCCNQPSPIRVACFNESSASRNTFSSSAYTQMSLDRPAQKWGAIRSMLALAPLFLALPLCTLYQQFTLPTPNVHPYDPQTGLPHPSEAIILSYAKFLSEDIGYRTPGTREHAEADAWMVVKAEEVRRLCEEIVIKEKGRKLECEVWRQEGSGSHRFDMMNARLYKTYVNLSNIIIRISDGTERGKASAVLINAHVDSTLPSPGAADDGLAVGVMLECARVLVETKGWEPTHSIIFLFNNAEESLQDGSHLFSTQHPIASTVRAVVNLEAAGTTGPELLFQATSEEMIEAYSHVPRPYGTIYANEIFSSGVLLSDTDFRQFEYYLNVTGLDMAVVGNSYMYHMRGDLVENIQPGVAQHMAENSLALLRFLSSDKSPIPRLEHGFARPRTVFFTNLGLFFIYSFTMAKIMYVTLFAASLFLVWATGVRRVWTALGAVISALVGGLIAANGLAFVMTNILHKGMSWFRAEYFPIILYCPAAVVGALITQVLFSRTGSDQTLEKPILAALLLFQSGLAAVGQLFNVGSSAAPFLGATGMLAALGVDALLARSRGISHANGEAKVNGNDIDKTAKKRMLSTSTYSDVSLWAYAIAMVIPLTTGPQLLAATLVVFVPLTGRIGGDAPSEFIIASIVTVLGAFMVSFGVPFAHRFGPAALRRALIFAILALGVVIAFFYNQAPFDRQHQKRLFVIHMEDLVTQEQHLHIAAADGAPGFDDLVHDIADKFGADSTPPKAIIMDDYINDWDALYPFSAFLSPFKIDLPLAHAYDAPWPIEERFSVTAVNDTIDVVQAGTRTLTIRIDHPGIIWTVIAFDAHVLEWTLDNNPPDEFARHHIKEASFYGTDTWAVTMTIKLPTVEDGESAATSMDTSLKIDFVGIQEKRMWPGKKAESDGGQAMKLFKEFDAWIEEKTGGTVDAMLLGCVRGETVV